jgi:hypothetical protein
LIESLAYKCNYGTTNMFHIWNRRVSFRSSDKTCILYKRSHILKSDWDYLQTFKVGKLSLLKEEKKFQCLYSTDSWKKKINNEYLNYIKFSDVLTTISNWIILNFWKKMPMHFCIITFFLVCYNHKQLKA